MTQQIFSAFDAADYLNTEEDIAAYIEAVMKESGDDSTCITRALATIARARNISQLSRDTGLSREGIYKALSEDGNPSFVTVSKIAHALGLRIMLGPASPLS